MSDKAGVHPYLVRPPGLEPELQQGYIMEALQDFIMRYGMLSMIAVREGVHFLAEAQIASYMGIDRAFFFRKIAQARPILPAVYRMGLEIASTIPTWRSPIWQ